jgi:hypothetical protein
MPEGGRRKTREQLCRKGGRICRSKRLCGLSRFNPLSASHRSDCILTIRIIGTPVRRCSTVLKKRQMVEKRFRISKAGAGAAGRNRAEKTPKSRLPETGHSPSPTQEQAKDCRLASFAAQSRPMRRSKAVRVRGRGRSRRHLPRDANRLPAHMIGAWRCQAPATPAKALQGPAKATV